MESLIGSSEIVMPDWHAYAVRILVHGSGLALEKAASAPTDVVARAGRIVRFNQRDMDFQLAACQPLIYNRYTPFSGPAIVARLSVYTT